MKDVFISYSRKDMVFAGRLVERLQNEKLDAWIDWQGIPYSAKWWLEICKGIDEAKNFVFIISPDSLTSRVCHLELQHARENNKRIIPVVRREVDVKMMAGEWFGKNWEAIARKNYEEIDKLNYIFLRKKKGYDCDFDLEKRVVTNPECDGEESDLDDFQVSFQVLIKTTQIDPIYVEEHTRLLTRARDWENKRGGVLRGTELTSAEAWLAGSEGKSPQPTDLHRQYIQVSRKATNSQRQLTVAGLAIGLIIALFLAGLSFVGFQNAEQQRVRADGNASTSDANAYLAQTQAARADNNAGTSDANVTLVVAAQATSDNNAALAADNAATALARGTLAAIEADNAQAQAARADNNASTAEANLVQALRGRALYLANTSEQQLNLGDPSKALLFALQAAENYPQIDVPAAHTALYRTLSNPVQQKLYLTQNDTINGATWNHDESQILTWSQDQTARVWDAENGTVLLTLVQGSAVWGASWSHNEDWIATRSPDGKVLIWDAKTGDRLQELRHGDGNPIYGFAWSNDDSQIVTWTRKGNFYVWNTQDGLFKNMLSHELKGEGFYAEAFWSPTDNRILCRVEETDTDHYGGIVRIWDLTNEPITLEDLGGDTNGIMWHPDGDRIAAWGVGGWIKIFDASNGEILADFGSESSVFGAQWDKNGFEILTWSQFGSAKIWYVSGDLDTGYYYSTPDSSTSPGMVRGASWNNKESRMLTWFEGLEGTNLFSADVWTLDGVKSFSLPHSTRIDEAQWSPDDKYILTRAQDNVVRVWSAENGQQLFSLMHDSPITSAVWSQDSSKILTHSQDGTVRVWVFESPLMIDHHENVTDPNWNGEQNRMFYVTDQGEYHIWDAALGATLTTFIYPDWDSFTQSLWDHAGNHILIYAPSEATAQIVDATTGDILIRLDHDTNIRGAVWSADDTTLLTWTSRNEISLWNVADGQLIRRFKADLAIEKLFWSPNQRQVAITSKQNAEIRDIDTGEKSYELELGYVFSVVWSSDGQRLLVWAEDGLARVVDAKNGNILLTVGRETKISPSSSSRFQDASWNRDESKILTWSQDLDQAFIWNASNGEQITVLGSGENFGGAKWSHDGKHILTFSNFVNSQSLDPEVVYIWNADTGALEHTLPHTLQASENGFLFIANAMWSSDDKRIVVWTDDGTIRFWDAINYDELFTIETSHTLSELEWVDNDAFLVTHTTPDPLDPPTEWQLWSLNYDNLLKIGNQVALQNQMSSDERLDFAIPTLVPTATTTIVPTAVIDLRLDSNLPLTELIGPLSADLPHEEDNYIELYSVDTSPLDNFVVDVEIANPYSAEQHAWSHGIFFDYGTSGYYLLSYQSDGTWDLGLYERETQAFTRIQRGILPNLSSDKNEVRLIVINQVGQFIFNGTIVSDLDLSTKRELGAIAIATGTEADSEVTGKTTHIENLIIYSIDQ